MPTPINTEQVVAVLKSAGLDSEVRTRRTNRAGFRVREWFGSGVVEIGISSDTMTAEQWQAAMTALQDAGYTFTYRDDAGMGARVTL